MSPPNIIELSPESLSLDGVLPGVVVGNQYASGEGPGFRLRSPIDGAELAEFQGATEEQVDESIDVACRSFARWRSVPAPKRGELIARFGNLLRAHKSALARLVTLEAGKIVAEAEGEVQEMIDICDFAVGLSRQLYGLTIQSERPQHRLMEQWHPLGPVGVISAFNFPVAVWAWNTTLALVCGDPVVWKPSERTPLCALACHRLLMEAASSMEGLPEALSTVILGDAETGDALARNPRLPLVSATGSVPMGRAVGQTVATRLGRCLLELGGNNGAIVTESARLDLVLRGSVFAAAGTCGQRCTTLRRLIVHHAVEQACVDGISKAFATLPVGDPREAGVLVGPLISEAAFTRMQDVLGQARSAGAEVRGGERVLDGVPPGGFYLRPALVRGLPHDHELVHRETFAPILYVLPFNDLEEAIALHNSVPQGLSSAIFTENLREAERFLSATGSDCGIANVNIGTSGAEIGGAFGGEKETGGGRESGSDAWKNYMRRQTATINFGEELPLAQGIKFEL